VLGRKRSDRRRKGSRGRKQKSDDFYRVRITLYLLEVTQQNKNQIQLNSKYGISTIEAGRLKILLLNMIDDDWIQEIKNSGVHYPVYKLSEKGLKIANFIKNPEEDHDFLSDMNCFANIKEIVS